MEWWAQLVVSCILTLLGRADGVVVGIGVVGDEEKQKAGDSRFPYKRAGLPSFVSFPFLLFSMKLDSFST